MSRPPKAGHNKAGRSDFRNQRFETDTGKTRKMRKVPLTPEKQGSEEIPKSKNAENAENADTKTRKMRKMRMTGFNVTGFRWPPRWERERETQADCLELILPPKPFSASSSKLAD